MQSSCTTPRSRSRSTSPRAGHRVPWGMSVSSCGGAVRSCPGEVARACVRWPVHVCALLPYLVGCLCWSVYVLPSLSCMQSCEFFKHVMPGGSMVCCA